MADETNIPWCKSTFSPWEGCTKVSTECANCYADARDARGLSGARHWGPKNDRKPMSASYWKQPLKWNRDAAKTGEVHTVFPSLCDPFDDHPSIDPEWRAALWNIIRMTPNLTWILLTKRPENFVRFLPADWGDGYPNVCLGVSAGTQEAARARIWTLLKTAARWRMVSVEPQLEVVGLAKIKVGEVAYVDALRGGAFCDGRNAPIETGNLDWVICGSESGPSRRPFDLDWARSLRDQCEAAGVPFFLKQIPGDGPRGVADTPMLDGRQWVQTPWGA